MCEPEKMTDIECRPLNKKKGLKDNVDKVDCSLDKGLVCNGKCINYELRVQCKCTKEISKYTLR